MTDDEIHRLRCTYVGAMFVLRVVLVALVASACGACSSSPEAPPPATVASPPVAPAAPQTSAEALEVLRAADAFEDAHIGYDGHLSRYVAAFRVVLAGPDAVAAFHSLVERATPAGRLYGAAGLYFADPPAYDAALARLAAGGGVVTRRQGCMGREESVATVVRDPKARRAEIPKGTTLGGWLRANPRSGECDLAGGCTPLWFLENDPPAPRDPVR